MDLEELRLNCLRMAHELGGKSEAVISAANDLMNFVTKGLTADTRTSAPEPAITDGAPGEVSVPEAEPAVTDRIAACGTALEMPESGDLAHAEPAVDVKAATEAEPAAAAAEAEAVPSEAVPSEAVPSEAVPSEAAAEEATPTAEIAAAGPSPEPIEPVAESTNGGAVAPAAEPEVEAAVVAGEPAARASEEAARSSEEHSPAAAPLQEGTGQEHTAN